MRDDDVKIAVPMTVEESERERLASIARALERLGGPEHFRSRAWDWFRYQRWLSEGE